MELADPTPSERNAILNKASLLENISGFDELDKDLFLHRLVDWKLMEIQKKYPSITLSQQKLVKEAYEKFRRSHHN